MRWNDVAADWPAFIDSLQTRWPETDRTELEAIDGDRDALNIYLGRVLALSPREADEQIDEWLRGPFPADAQMDEVRDNANIGNARKHIPPGEDVYDDDAAFGDDDLSERPVGRS